MAIVIKQPMWRDADGAPKTVIERRAVLVAVAPGHYTDPYRRAFTLEEVARTIDEWGRAPIDLERTRAMLVDLAKRLKSNEGESLQRPADLVRHLAAGRVVTLETSACRIDAMSMGASVLASGEPGRVEGVELTLRTLGAPR